MTKALSQVSDNEGAEESRCPAVLLNSALRLVGFRDYPACDYPRSMSQKLPESQIAYKESLHTAQWANLNAYAKAVV